MEVPGDSWGLTLSPTAARRPQVQPHKRDTEETRREVVLGSVCMGGGAQLKNWAPLCPK